MIEAKANKMTLRPDRASLRRVAYPIGTPRPKRDWLEQSAPAGAPQIVLGGQQRHVFAFLGCQLAVELPFS